MVAQKSQGIQTLLEAEKEASKIVEKARACTLSLAYADRTQRLKDAQGEAENEIAALQRKNDAAIADFQNQFAGSQTQQQGALDQDTQEQLDAIRKAFASKSDALVQKLLERVAAVDPQPHRNLEKVAAK